MKCFNLVRSPLITASMMIGLGLLTFSTPSKAAIISGTYTIFATDFTTLSGAAPPIEDFNAEIAVTFNTTQPPVNEAVDSASTDFPFTPSIVFNYIPQGIVDDVIDIGAFDSVPLSFGANDFRVTIDNATTSNPTGRSVSYRINEPFAPFFTSTNVTVRFTPNDVTPIPEPSSLIVMASALGTLGFMKWGRKSK
jgi:hypothetical protein